MGVLFQAKGFRFATIEPRRAGGVKRESGGAAGKPRLHFKVGGSPHSPFGNAAKSGIAGAWLIS